MLYSFLWRQWMELRHVLLAEASEVRSSFDSGVAASPHPNCQKRQHVFVSLTVGQEAELRNGIVWRNKHINLHVSNVCGQQKLFK